jgi:hypothetical protein
VDYLSEDLADIPDPDDSGCAHSSILAWRKCMGCRTSTLPASKERAAQSREDAA